MRTPIPSFERDDLLQLGRLALWRAWQLFDPHKGVKFTTYMTQVLRHEYSDIIQTRFKRYAITTSDEVAMATVAAPREEPLLFDDVRRRLGRKATLVFDVYLSPPTELVFSSRKDRPVLLTQAQVAKHLKMSDAEVSECLRQIRTVLRQLEVL